MTIDIKKLAKGRLESLTEEQLKQAIKAIECSAMMCLNNSKIGLNGEPFLENLYYQSMNYETMMSGLNCTLQTLRDLMIEKE